MPAQGFYLPNVEQLVPAAPGGWKTNPMDAIYMSAAAADAKNQAAMPQYNELKQAAAAALVTAQTSEAAATAVNFTDTALNDKAKADIQEN